MTITAPPLPPVTPVAGRAAAAAALAPAALLSQLGVTGREGLAAAEVTRRQARWGPSAVSSHRARLLPVLWHQLRSPLLGLLLAAATVSYVTGEHAGEEQLRRPSHWDIGFIRRFMIFFGPLSSVFGFLRQLRRRAARFSTAAGWPGPRPAPR